MTEMCMKITEKQYRPFVTAVLAAVQILAVSCRGSQELTREMAERLLKESVVTRPEPQDVVVKKRYSRRTADLSQVWDVPSSSFQGSEERVTQVEKFLGDGLLRITREWPRNQHGVWTDFELAVTDAGRPFVLVDDSFKYQVRTCDVVFGKVTGIQVNPANGEATVEYSLRFDNWTPFGESLKRGLPGPIPESIGTRSATALKYDDGWRLR